MTTDTNPNPNATPAPGSEQPAPNAQPAGTPEGGTHKQDNTPAPAPVAPTLGDAPAPNDNAVPVNGKADDKGVILYDKTGDVRLDTALDFIGKLGLGPDNAAVKAAQDGDFSLLKAELARHGDKAAGWEQFVALAESAFADNKAKTEAATKAIVEAVHGAVGGEEAWAPIQAWAKENADDSERGQINAMFAQGPFAAKAAAAYLKSLYDRANGTTVEPASATTTDARTNDGAANSGALSPAEYVKAVTALAAKLGGHIDGSPEYAELQRRRMAYRP